MTKWLIANKQQFPMSSLLKIIAIFIKTGRSEHFRDLEIESFKRPVYFGEFFELAHERKGKINFVIVTDNGVIF